MKKLLLILSLFVSAHLFAQKDIEIIMDSPAVNQNIYAGVGFNLKYSVKNVGTIDIPASDSLILVMTINNNPTTPIIINHGGITSGQTKSGSLNNIALNFTTTLNGANFCLVTFLRYNGPLDTATSNNLDCATLNMIANTGIDELAAAQSMKVYPNPAVDKVNFESTYQKASVLHIFDITGKRIESIATANGNVRLDVSQYRDGIYMYEFVSSENLKIKTGKFTVSH